MADGLVVADTDLVIDFLRGRRPGAAAVRGWLESGRLRLTAITAFELRVGIVSEELGTKVLSLLAERTLPLDVDSAWRAGEAFDDLRRTGRDIGVKDTLIAGICLSHGLPLATRNGRHFERVPGLKLEPVGEDRQA